MTRDERSQRAVLRHAHTKQAKTTVILTADPLWAVGFNGSLISIVHERPGATWRYPKSVFAAVQQADRLAAKLNTMFETTAFAVMALDAQHAN